MSKLLPMEAGVGVGVGNGIAVGIIVGTKMASIVALFSVDVGTDVVEGGLEVSSTLVVGLIVAVNFTSTSNGDGVECGVIVGCGVGVGSGVG